MSWRIEGEYFESCNCEAICPCRMVGGIAGGRSTHGICLGALSWRVDAGEKDGVDLAGLAAALVCRYDDDEPGSPWRFVLHVDARGDDAQRAALEEILLGRAGGEQILRLPWVRKPSELLAVRASAIELGGGELRVGEAVRLRATRPVESEEPVRCGIPGYDEPGRELYADELTVDDGELRWELAGNCAFVSRFAYAG
ncbi:MAG: DUF1326 domain-containing protein [Gaiellaceae bacterium]